MRTATLAAVQLAVALTISVSAPATTWGKGDSGSGGAAKSYKSSQPSPAYKPPPAPKAPQPLKAPQSPKAPRAVPSPAPRPEPQSVKYEPQRSGYGASGGSAPRSITGKRTAHDGDTFYANGVSYRVRGIDTPELGAPRSQEAKERLHQLLGSGNVTVRPVGKDKYGRTVAQVMVNGQDVAEILKREGYSKPK